MWHGLCDDHRHGGRRRRHAGKPCRRRCAPGSRQRIGFTTAVYTNGLLIGEILPVALMLPLVLPLVGNWQRGFVVWSVPVRDHRDSGNGAGRGKFQRTVRHRRAAAGADWNSALIWRLGIMLGTINATISRPMRFCRITCGAMDKRLDQRGPVRIECRQLPASSCCSRSPAGWSARHGLTSPAGYSA